MEDERDEEDAEGQQHDEDQEEDDEGEDTESVKNYVIDDDERNPHATSSPKGNITIMLHIFLSNDMLASMKYNIFYLCRTSVICKLLL